MFTDHADVEQYTSKSVVTCSWHAKPYKFEPSKAHSDSCGTFSGGNESEFSFLDKFHQHDTYNSSIASIETDNLREGLKSIDNPIFEVKIGKNKISKLILYFELVIIFHDKIK